VANLVYVSGIVYIPVCLVGGILWNQGFNDTKDPDAFYSSTTVVLSLSKFCFINLEMVTSAVITETIATIVTLEVGEHHDLAVLEDLQNSVCTDQLVVEDLLDCGAKKETVDGSSSFFIDSLATVKEGASGDSPSFLMLMTLGRSRTGCTISTTVPIPLLSFGTPVESGNELAPIDSTSGCFGTVKSVPVKSHLTIELIPFQYIMISFSLVYWYQQCHFQSLPPDFVFFHFDQCIRDYHL
jgi:hypothetical protein